MPNPIETRLYLHNPSVVFQARINQPVAAEYPIASVVYDTVTAGSFGAIRPGMTLLIGTTSLSDDLGRQRVRPQLGVDGGRENYFFRNFTIPIIKLRVPA